MNFVYFISYYILPKDDEGFGVGNCEMAISKEISCANDVVFIQNKMQEEHYEQTHAEAAFCVISYQLLRTEQMFKR